MITTPAHNQTMLPIHFLVVGGGISGLSCAVALRRTGHEVTVLEQVADLDAMPSGGSRLAPMEMKLFGEWGLGEAVSKIARTFRRLNIRDYHDGSSGGTISLLNGIEEDVSGNYAALMQRDLRSILYNAAVDLGVQYRFSARVVKIDAAFCAATIASGETLSGDVIVGADGVFGLVREAVSGAQTRPEINKLVYRCVLAPEIMEKDPELRTWAEKAACRTGFCTLGYSSLWSPTGNCRVMTADHWVACPSTSWIPGQSVPDITETMGSPTPLLKKLLTLSKTEYVTPMGDYPLLPDWVHQKGRVLVVANAALPIPSGALSTDGMVVEDAALLAQLFAHISSHEQIDTLLRAFETLARRRRSYLSDREARTMHAFGHDIGDAEHAQQQVEFLSTMGLASAETKSRWRRQDA